MACEVANCVTCQYGSNFSCSDCADGYYRDRDDGVWLCTEDATDILESVYPVFAVCGLLVELFVLANIFFLWKYNKKKRRLRSQIETTGEIVDLDPKVSKICRRLTCSAWQTGGFVVLQTQGICVYLLRPRREYRFATYEQVSFAYTPGKCEMTLCGLQVRTYRATLERIAETLRNRGAHDDIPRLPIATIVDDAK